MPRVDWGAIGSNIAVKSLISGVAVSSYPPPTELSITPAVVVFPPNAQHIEYPSLDEWDSRWTVRLYVERTADFAEPAMILDPYIGAMYDAWESQKLLGLPGIVQDSYIVSHEIDHLPDYGGAYIGARFEVAVRVIVPATRTA